MSWLSARCIFPRKMFGVRAMLTAWWNWLMQISGTHVLKNTLNPHWEESGNFSLKWVSSLPLFHLVVLLSAFWIGIRSDYTHFLTLYLGEFSRSRNYNTFQTLKSKYGIGTAIRSVSFSRTESNAKGISKGKNPKQTTQLLCDEHHLFFRSWLVPGPISLVSTRLIYQLHFLVCMSSLKLCVVFLIIRSPTT